MIFENLINRIGSFGAAWRDAVPNPRQSKPTVIQFPINNTCNSGCQMCDIWQQKKGVEITAEDVRKILSHSLFNNVTAIGFNGGEPTLRRDFKDLVVAAIDSLPRLMWVSLITNAIIPSRVRNCIDDLAEICSNRGVKLDVMVSVDGVGDVHDRVRGKKGNFASAEEIVEYIVGHPGVHSPRIGCTVIRENVYDVENVLEWAKKKGVYARFRRGIPHQRLYTESKTEPFALTKDEQFYFCNFLDNLRFSYEKSPARNDFYLSLRNQIAYGAPRAAGCAWKSKGVTLLSDGGFAYCAVSSPVLGNAIGDDPEKMYWGNSEILERIKLDKCATCLHDYEGISSRKTLLKGVGAKLNRRFPIARKLAKPVKSALLLTQRVRKSTKNPSCRGQSDLPASQRLIVVGWYGTETLGDKAILGGLLWAIRQAKGSIQVDIASLEPYVTEHTKRQMPELSNSEVISLAVAEERLRERYYSDFVFGGGPLMSSIPQIVDLSNLAALAKDCGAKVIVAGCGIGPLGVDRGDQAIREILSCADRIVLRDEYSKKLAGEMGIKLPLQAAVDPAFIWIESNKHPVPERRKTVLLALRDWPVHEYAIGLSEADDIKKRFDGQISAFIKTMQSIAPEYDILPICMHRLAVGGDDKQYYTKVLADFPDLLAKISVPHQAPLDDLRVFENASGILAMRFHSVVFGLATNLAVVAVDYTLGGKIAGVLRDGGCEPPVPISDFDGESAARCMIEKLRTANRKQIAVSAAQRAYVELFQ